MSNTNEYKAITFKKNGELQVITNENLSTDTVAALEEYNKDAQLLYMDIYNDRKQTQQWGVAPVANPYKTYLGRLKFDSKDATANLICKTLLNQAKTTQGGNTRDDVEAIVSKYVDDLNDFYRKYWSKEPDQIA